MTTSNTRKIGTVKLQSMSFDVLDFGDDRLEYTVDITSEDNSDRYVVSIGCTDKDDDDVTFTVDSSGGLEYDSAMAFAGSDIANFVYYTLFVKHIRL